MTTQINTPTDARDSIVLDVTGMTCASCAARIEKKVGKLPGVSVTVNYATNKALVLAPTGITAEDLIRTVEQAGYGASVPVPDAPPPPDPAELLKRRVIIAAILAVAVAIVYLPPWSRWTEPLSRRRRASALTPGDDVIGTDDGDVTASTADEVDDRVSEPVR